MFKKIIAIGKISLISLAMVGLLAGCGTMVDSELDTPVRDNGVVETKDKEEESKEEESKEEEETKETESTTESEATTETEVTESTSTETNIVEGNKEESTTESTGIRIEKDNTPGVNAGYIVSELREYEEKYITYEAMEPTIMYVIQYADMYADFNATEGAFRMEGNADAGDKLNIDGKGTYEGVEYYRLVHYENSFNPYHVVIPAEALSFEKPAEQETVDDPELIGKLKPIG